MRKTGLITACAISFLLGSQNPAQAVDFDDILRAVLSGVTRTLPYDSTTVQSNIDIRKATLENQITSGVTTGQLTVDEAADLRNRLRAASNLEITYAADGSLTYDETRRLIDDLTEVSRRLDLYLTNSSTVGENYVRDHNYWFRKFGARPLQNGTLPNAALRKAHIATEQAEINSKIEQGAIDGTLSWAEQRDLRNKLNDIKSDEVKFMVDGRLSFSEEASLRSALASLSARTNRELTDRNNRRKNHPRHRTNSTVNARQSVLHNRIAYGVKTGKIDSSEAERLYQKERRIAKLESQLKKDRHRLNWREEQRLLNRLDNLSNEINNEIYDL